MAMADPSTRAQARRLAFNLLGTAFDEWRKGFAEERRKGTSEAEITAAVDTVIANLEQQRGRVDDLVIDEMILMVKECAYATHDAPGKQ
jgi:Asp-tRNA(Asn)/Glu-tRNA(Gln) amidotransferase A subunit family amidase